MKKRYLLFPCLALVLFGCTLNPVLFHPSKGTVQLKIEGLPKRSVQAQLSDIDHVLVWLETARNATASLTFSSTRINQGSISTRFDDLWPGEATVSVKVYDSGDGDIGFAQATASIKAGEVTDLGMNFKLTDTGILAGNLQVVGTILPPVLPAPVPPSGTLGNFVKDNLNSLVYPVCGAASVQIGQKIYLIGGSADGSKATDSIQVTTLDANGEIGPFERAGHLATPHDGATAEVIGDYLYIFGGDTTGTSNGTGTIDRAPINGDGTLGNFTTLPATLSEGRAFFNTIYTGNYVYAFGGRKSFTQFLASVERASVNPDGSLGTFQDTGFSLQHERWTQAAVRIGNNLYVLGGEDAWSSLDSIEKSTIGADGTLSAFVSEPETLSEPRNRIAAVALSGKLFLFGGWANHSFLTDVDTSSIDGATHTLGVFATSPETWLAMGVESGTALLTNKAAFYFGGNGTGGITNIIQRAPIIPIQ